MFDPVWKYLIITCSNFRRILTLQANNFARHDLVENVVRTLKGLLGDDTGLLQQVCVFKLKFRISFQSFFVCLCHLFSSNLQVSMSAPANLPELPKWIRMNLPCLSRGSWWVLINFLLNFERGNLRNGKSCRYGWSWRYQRLQVQG